MSIPLHPRMRARLERTALQRTLAADNALLEAIAAVEALARDMTPEIGAGMTEAVLDTCRVLRRSMETHAPTSPSGAVIRRFLPTRLAELRLVCTDTAMMLSDRVLIDA